MNKAYNVVFNKSIGEYQVTSELTSSRKKSKSSKRRIIVAMATSLFLSVASAGINVGDNGTVTLYDPFTQINNDLSNVSFTIKDSDTSDFSNLNSSITNYITVGNTEDLRSVHNNLNLLVDEQKHSFFQESVGQLRLGYEDFKISETLNAEKDRNIVIKKGGYIDYAGIENSTTTLFNNKNKLILAGVDVRSSFIDPNEPRTRDLISINNNKVEGDLITNSGSAFFDNIQFENNKGNITNTGTMIFNDINYYGNIGTIYNYDTMLLNRFYLDSSRLVPFSNSNIYNEGALLITESDFTQDRVTFVLGAGTTIMDQSVLSGGYRSDDSVISPMIVFESDDAALTIQNSKIEKLVSSADIRALSLIGGKSIYLFNNEFSFNNSSDSGGALIITEENQDIDLRLVNNSFLKNTAMGDGGAIYTHRDLTLEVEKGHAAWFKDNLRAYETETESNASTGIFNSIASANNNNLLFKIDGLLSMEDPLYKLGSVTKEGHGRWKLGGSNEAIDNFYIKEGTLELYGQYDGFSYDRPQGSGRLHLENDFILGSSSDNPITLLINGANSIDAKNIYLNNTGVDYGSTISFNFQYSDGSETSTDGYWLTLAGENVFTKNSINIDLNTFYLEEGIYQLIRTTGDNVLDSNQYRLTVDGKNLTGTRLGDAYQLVFSDDQKTIDLISKEVSTTLNTWTGASTNDSELWNSLNEKNWSHASGEFLDGDSVIFGEEGAGVVRVEDGSRAKFIYLSGSKNYQFVGSLNTVPVGYRHEDNSFYSTDRGQLVLSAESDEYAVGEKSDIPLFSGELDLTKTRNNLFLGGIEIGGGRLKISRFDQILSDDFFSSGGDEYPIYGDIGVWEMGAPNVMAFTGNDGQLVIENDADMVIDNYYFQTRPDIYSFELPSIYIKAQGTGKLIFDKVLLNGQASKLFTIEGDANNPILFTDKSEISSNRGFSGISIINANFNGSKFSFDENPMTHFQDIPIILKGSIFNNIKGNINLLSSLTEIDNTQFINNRDTKWEFSGKEVNISGSDFINNGHSERSSFLFLKGETANIQYSNFIGNSAYSGGGASVFLYSGTGLKIEHSTFIGNFAGEASALGIGKVYGNNTVSNTLFKDNLVVNSYLDERYGGTVNITENSDESLDNSVTFSKVTFTGNQVLESTNIPENERKPHLAGGGAIFSNIAILNINDGSLFENNSVDGVGGAILSDTYKTVNITDTTFKENSAQFYGGAIYGDFLSLNITDSQFNNNITSDEDGRGGAIYYSGLLNLNAVDDNIVLSGNKANDFSSGIYIADKTPEKKDRVSTLNINASKGRLVDMQDSLMGETNVTVVKSGEGSWKLGSTESRKAATFGEKATFSLQEGTFDLHQNSDLTFGKDSKISFGSDGKHTTFIANGDNKIYAEENEILFNTGEDDSTSTTLSLNVSQDNKIGSIEEISADNAALSLYGTVKVAGKNGINLDVSGMSGGAGNYALLYTSSINKLNTGWFNLKQEMTYNGESIDNITRLSNLSLVLNAAGNALVLKKEGESALTNIATWTNAKNDNLWYTNHNWRTESSSGVKVELSTFIAGDFANFASLNAGIQNIKLNNQVDAAGIYIDGTEHYTFELDGVVGVDGLTASQHQTTFNNALSSGKLVLGQHVVRKSDGSLSTNKYGFTGVVDLTGTNKNSFEGGVDIYGGTLKISHQDQLGTTLDKLTLAGTKDNAATLLVDDGQVLFSDAQQLIVAEESHAVLEAKDSGTIKFSNNQLNATSQEGALIENRGSLALNNIIFDSNTTSAAINVAIWNRGEQLTLTDTVFRNNVGTSESVALLYNMGGLLIQGASLFEKNSGDTLSVIYNGRGDIVIRDNVIFRENSTLNSGGTISFNNYNNYYDKYILDIEGALFEGNSATNSGGAIYNLGGKILLSNNQFIGNSASGGGAIYNRNAYGFDIVDSLFENNHASKFRGGAIYSFEEFDDYETASITNTVFNENSSRLEGGAIFFSGRADHELVISNSEFLNNKTKGASGENANSYGGALYKSQGLLTINDSLFEGNQAINELTGIDMPTAGGAIFNIRERMNVTNTHFVKNITEGKGGAIHTTGDLTITDSLFNQNQAGKGGAISSNQILNIINSEFTGNTASEAGAIYMDNYLNSVLTITNSKFENNSATAGSAGAIMSQGSLYITDTDFFNNISHIGGAISHTASDDIQLNVTSGVMTFSGNRSLDGRNSSIYFFDNILDINVANNALLDMQNPIYGDSWGHWLETDYVGVVKKGAGNWYLGGTSELLESNARFDIEEGQLSLYGKGQAKDVNGDDIVAASIKMAGKNSSFNLGSSDQNVALIINGGNSIDVKEGAINFNTGDSSTQSATLEFNPTADNWTSDTDSITMDNAALKLYGAVNFVGSNALQVKVNLTDLDDGYYTLIYSDSATNFSEEKFNYVTTDFLYQGKSLSSIERLTDLPFSYLDGNALVFKFGGVQAKNQGIATWTGLDQSEGNQNVWNNLLAANWHTIDSDGKESSVFSNKDFVNFSLEDKAEQQIKIEGGVQASGIYISGAATYLFDGDGFHSAINETSFNPTTSSGKLVLGQIATSDKKDITFKESDFTGVVDLTGTDKNTFEGGVDIYGGTLKISHQDQLGTTLDKLTLAGTKDNIARLLVSGIAREVTLGGGDNWTRFVVDSGNSGTFETEEGATLKFRGPTATIKEGFLIQQDAALSFIGEDLGAGEKSIQFTDFTLTEPSSNHLFLNYGAANFENALFTKNTIGGSILYRNYGGTTTFKDSVFSGNSGTLIRNADTMLLDNVTFSNNIAGTDHQLMILHNEAGIAKSTTEISNSLFEGNDSGIHIKDKNVELTVKDSIFKDNRYTSIYDNGSATNAVVNISDSIFEGNKSEQGGVLYIQSGVWNIASVQFINNISTQNGGAFYLNGNNHNITIADSAFIGNRSLKASGGAIYLSGIDNHLIITNTEFVNNTVTATEQKGGAIYLNSGNTLNITESRFLANEANGNTQRNIYMDGGAISAISGNIITIDDSQFIGNKSDGYRGNTASKGGAISLDGNGGANTLIINKGELTDNYAEGSGGAISAVKDNKIEIADTKFSGNSSSRGGCISWKREYSNDKRYYFF